MSKQVADAIRETLASPNVADANSEPANVVDALHQIARGLFAVARAVEGQRQAAASDEAH